MTPDALRAAGLIHNLRLPVKVLARGEVTKALTVQAHKFSGKAAEKLAAAGGKAEAIAYHGTRGSTLLTAGTRTS